MFRWLRRKPEDPQRQLEAALGEYDLPSFPTVVFDALAALRDPDTSLKQVGSRILADPGASARMLRLVNSAAQGLRHPVRNVEHAVSLLGRSQVEKTLLALGTSRAISAEAPPGFDVAGFWKGAAERAAVASALAGRLHPRTRSESFTAALLSDLAVPLLARGRHGYTALLTEVERDRADLHAVERDTYGWDHGFIAAAVCQRWAFPEPLTDAIGGHHDEESEERLPALRLAAALEGDDGVDRAVALGETAYGLPADEVLEALEHARAHAAEIAGCLR